MPSPSPPSLIPPPDPPIPTGDHTPTSPTYRPRGIHLFSSRDSSRDSVKDRDNKHTRQSSKDPDKDKAPPATSDDEHNAVSTSWWDDRTRVATRPWHNPPRRRRTIPPAQPIAYARTQDAVVKALRAVLSTSVDAAHEVLSLAADALRYTPVLGLSEVARVLLNIWDGIGAVETNRLSCLRLTERCATILYSIKAEIDTAGTDVADTLHDPLDKLIDAFRRVEYFVDKQRSRPFLKRYLRRDDDARRVAVCDAALSDSVGLFGIAIQVRMLREVLAQARARAHDGDSDGVPPYAVHADEDALRDPRAAIVRIRAAQAARDATLDREDLYAAMRGALRMGSDVAMLGVLQIKKSDLPEAMKTLQRALEDPKLAPAPAYGVMKALPPPPPSLEPPPLAADALGLGLVGPIPGENPGLTLVHSPEEDSWVQHAWAGTRDAAQDAAFHREFLESGLEALRRVSVMEGGAAAAAGGGAGGAGAAAGAGRLQSLPAWTITRWEVDRESRIGVGFFSDVFKGMWRGRQVAIKVLAPTTPRSLFRRETAIWASLRHPHVLELLGASSALGDPPWFFVSPYMKNGALTEYLRERAAGGRSPGRGRTSPGVLQMMREVAIGMAYLHQEGVLHGDLKANNVLIDDDLHCVISDFGQSELRSELLRVSHKQRPHGALRWQAPEIISGQGNLTPEVDVYAFAIVCVEILTNGEVPWGNLLDDTTVQQLVLRHNRRPHIPLHPELSLPLVSLIEHCWSTDPAVRPAFENVAHGLGYLESGVAGPVTPSPRSRILDIIREEEERRISPDLAPVQLPQIESCVGPEAPITPLSESGASEQTSEQSFFTPVSPATIPLQRVVTRSSEESLFTREMHDEALVGGSSRGGGSSPTSEMFVSMTGEAEDNVSDVESLDGELWDGYASPLPKDDWVAARRNERRYRLLLQHDFNPSLNLPLWDPTPVRLGAVGYLEKPRGTFVTLFNALTAGDGLPSIHGYGTVREAEVRQDRRTVAQRGMDIIQGALTFMKGRDGTFSRAVSRRHSFPLRAGHKHAYLCTENTTYQYMVDIGAAKAWFRANIQMIVSLYGAKHGIQREDIVLVIGALEAREWALFVSHEHPDGEVHFNVFTERREGQDWGSFSTDTVAGPGPAFERDAPASVHASKISAVRAGVSPAGVGGAGGGGGGPADAVLLARLRFKPDVDEPTRL